VRLWNLGFQNLKFWEIFVGLGKFSGQAQNFLGQAKPAFLPPGYVAASITCYFQVKKLNYEIAEPKKELNG
jgi:hypothetical protein